MNGLEAARFLDSYMRFLANRPKTYTFATPISKIPFYCEDWKDKLLMAAKLDTARRMIWAGECPPGYLDQLEVCLMSASSIVPVSDFVGFDLLKASETIEKGNSSKIFAMTNKKKIEEAKKILAEYQPKVEMFRTDSFGAFCEHMTQYIKNVFLPELKSGEEPIEEYVFRYSLEAYRVAGIPYDDGYDVYFYSIKQMQLWAMDPKMKHFFKRYEDVLFDVKDRIKG